MSAEFVDSAFIQALATLPSLQLTTGEGAPGLLKIQSDVVRPTAAGIANVGSTYRLARVPTYAKIKGLVVDVAGALDTNSTGALSLDFNIAFSDNAKDGTPQALLGTIPTTAKNGTVTTVAAYSTPNKLFGSLVSANSGVNTIQKNILFNGSLAGWLPDGINVPLYEFFGFVDNNGNPSDPGGFFDLLAYVGIVPGTAGAGFISAKVDFVV